MTGPAENVSVREFFERLLREQSSHLETKFKHLEDKIDDLQKSNAKALETAAIETERRLEALNGEAARLATVLAQSIPREVHERDMKGINEKLENLGASRSVSTGRNQQQQVIISLALSVISAIGVVVAVFVAVVKP